MRVLLYAKMLKETKTKETIVFFVTFLSLVAFQLGGPGPPGPPLATPKLMPLTDRHYWLCGWSNNYCFGISKWRELNGSQSTKYTFWIWYCWNIFWLCLEFQTLLGGAEENILIALLPGKRSFLRISVFNMRRSFNGLVSQQAPI